MSGIDMGQKAGGFITDPVNFLIFALLTAGAYCFYYLFKKHVYRFLSRFLEKFLKIPLWAYEFILYVLSIALIILGLFLNEAIWAGFTGALLFFAGLEFSIYVRKIAPSEKKMLSWLSFTWIIVALLYQSELIGFMAIAALLRLAYELCENKKTDDIVTWTVINFIFLAGSTVAHVCDIPAVRVLETGAFWLAGIGFFLGILAISSKWWCEKFTKPCHLYAIMQIVAISAIFGTMFTSSFFGLYAVRGIAGVALLLYVFVQKPYEIAEKYKKHWAIIGLSVAAIGAPCLYWINSHIEIIWSLFSL